MIFESILAVYSNKINEAKEDILKKKSKIHFEES